MLKTVTPIDNSILVEREYASEGEIETVLKNAYEASEKLIFTDDASVFEYCGGAITTIIGEEKNIKITTNDDVLIASKLA